MANASNSIALAPPVHHDAFAVTDFSAGSEHAIPTASTSTMPLSAVVPKSAPLGAQMDAVILDDYLTSLLVSKFTSSLEPLFSVTTSMPTIKMWIQPILTVATLWATQSQTPATKALGLQRISIQDEATRRKALLRYIVLAVLLPLVYQQLQRWVMKEELQPPFEDESNLEADEEQIRQRLARERKFQVARRFVQAVDTTVPVLQLGLLLSYLVPRKFSSITGNNNTMPSPSPELAMRLAGLRYARAPSPSTTDSMPATATVVPQLYVLYAHRRWLYEHAFSTVRLVLSPLAMEAPSVVQRIMGSVAGSIQRPLSQLWHHVRNSMIYSRDEDGPDAELERTTDRCALCQAHPIRVPYDSDACRHVFCYTCLWNATINVRTPARLQSSHRHLINGSHHQQGGQIFGTGFPCPVCRALVRSSRPLPISR